MSASSGLPTRTRGRLGGVGGSGCWSCFRTSCLTADREAGVCSSPRASWPWPRLLCSALRPQPYAESPPGPGPSAAHHRPCSWALSARHSALLLVPPALGTSCPSPACCTKPRCAWAQNHAPGYTKCTISSATSAPCGPTLQPGELRPCPAALWKVWVLSLTLPLPLPCGAEGDTHPCGVPRHGKATVKASAAGVSQGFYV